MSQSEQDNEYFLHHRRSGRGCCGGGLSRTACLGERQSLKNAGHQASASAWLASKVRTGEQSMKSLTTLVIGGLVVALSVVGYLYYERTSNDITIQLPKVSLTK
jgi:hypothetical protein